MSPKYLRCNILWWNSLVHVFIGGHNFSMTVTFFFFNFITFQCLESEIHFYDFSSSQESSIRGFKYSFAMRLPKHRCLHFKGVKVLMQTCRAKWTQDFLDCKMVTWNSATNFCSVNHVQTIFLFEHWPIPPSSTCINTT